MTIKASFRHFTQVLSSLYPQREAMQIADMVFEKVTGFSRLDRITRSGTPLTTAQQKKLEAMGKRLLENMPVQYVLGEAWFCNLKLKVNKDVLIPRPETEELVQWILNDIKNDEEQPVKINEHPLTVLDIGTGSGCIAVVLKKNLPSLHMTAIDNSAEALRVAKHNAASHQTDIFFRKLDITNDQHISLLPVADIIVSNPPYVPFRDKKDMQPQVALYEPPQALFVPDDDPLFFYKRILQIARMKLLNGGNLYFEIHADYGKEVAEWMEKLDFKRVTLRKDMSGHDRMVKGTKDQPSNN